MGIRILGLVALPMLACSASSATSPVITAADASFLQGNWCGASEGDRIEEAWLAPVADESMGLSRTVRDGKVANFEFMRITRRDGKLQYLAQPDGEAPTSFPLAEWGVEWLAFENLEHDFPQRIEYAKQGDSLLAVISGPGKDGAREEISVRYGRCVPGSPGPTGGKLP